MLRHHRHPSCRPGVILVQYLPHGAVLPMAVGVALAT